MMKGRAAVTGSSSGIGAAIARRLLDEGWEVAGLDIAPPVIAHPSFSAVAVDLADASAARAAAAKTGAVTALVHAAGVMRAGRLGALEDQTSALLWSLHVNAAIALADSFAPGMTAGGRIVMIGSRAAQGVEGKSQYGAAKAALASLARTWAKELAPRNITVNVVSPAATETAMLTDPARTMLPPETPPIGRRIRPEEVAALVCFLLSEDAAAITGQEIKICGGSSL